MELQMGTIRSESKFTMSLCKRSRTWEVQNEGSQGRNPKQEHENKTACCSAQYSLQPGNSQPRSTAEAMEDCCLLIYSGLCSANSLFKQPNPSGQGMVPPLVGWACLNHPTRQSLTDTSAGQSDLGDYWMMSYDLSRWGEITLSSPQFFLVMVYVITAE